MSRILPTIFSSICDEIRRFEYSTENWARFPGWDWFSISRRNGRVSDTRGSFFFQSKITKIDTSAQYRIRVKSNMRETFTFFRKFRTRYTSIAIGQKIFMTRNIAQTLDNRRINLWINHNNHFRIETNTCNPRQNEVNQTLSSSNGINIKYT